jgi:serine phosphatase RsbU (regulator of sigma subunit)
MYTDGLIEGWATPEGGDRLGVEGVCEILSNQSHAWAESAELPAWLVSEVEERNGGALADDVAVVLISPSSGTAR